MITKHTCKLYQHPIESLQNKLSVPCKMFENTDYQLVTDSQDIEFWLNFIGAHKSLYECITGIMILVGDGDLIDVWLSESSAPYDLWNGIYHVLDYYRPCYKKSIQNYEKSTPIFSYDM